MTQFSLDIWLQDKSRKVVTRDGRPVRIVCWDMKSMSPIVGIIQDRLGGEFIRSYALNGRYSTKNESEYDLFFANEEEKPQSIEIPFGAKDSEFIKDEYYIPEGCEARIEGNKVIIEKIQKEELTEFEKTMIQFSHERNSLIQFEHTKEEINAHLYLYSEKLLDLARKELQPEFDKKMDKMLAETDKVVYQKGQQDALKSLPKWKKATEHKDLEKHIAILEDGKVLLSNYLEEGDYYIELEDLETLPKEE